MSKKLTTVEFAKITNLTPARIRQLIDGEIVLAEKLGRDWLIEDEFVALVKNRPEKRGRKSIKKAA